MSSSDFNQDRQVVFKSSLAQAAGVAISQIIITSIVSVTSKLIHVVTSIQTSDESAVVHIENSLKEYSLDSRLFAGLDVPTYPEGLSTDEPQNGIQPSC